MLIRCHVVCLFVVLSMIWVIEFWSFVIIGCKYTVFFNSVQISILIFRIILFAKSRKSPVEDSTGQELRHSPEAAAFF